MELASLKADNECLLGLLKSTSDYCDLTEGEIIKAASSLQKQGVKGFKDSFQANLRSRGIKDDQNSAKNTVASKIPKNNDWIPTEAVRKIAEIKNAFNAEMTETCVSKILYDLNIIWREIMRKESEAIKKRM